MADTSHAQAQHQVHDARKVAYVALFKPKQFSIRPNDALYIGDRGGWVVHQYSHALVKQCFRNVRSDQSCVGDEDGQRGNASRTPPSTGIIAPVVREERSLASQNTASATSSAVTRSFSRFRDR